MDATGQVISDLVDIAPTPVLAGFNGSNHGMLGLVKVFGGVLILRRVAASDMATGQANSEMDPSIAHLDALFAYPLGRLQILCVSYVLADLHTPSL
jgi:hypothetical protein